MKQLIEKMLDTVIRWLATHRTINSNAKCPACGACKGKINYDPVTKRVLHSCEVCVAVWPEMPRIPSHAWDLIGRDLERAEELEKSVRERFAKANAPLKATPAQEVK